MSKPATTSHNRRGLWIEIEGLDGAGKTTQAKRLVSAISASGENAVYLRNPGSSDFAEQLRPVILGKANRPPEADLAVFAATMVTAAAEAQNLLAAGSHVICDRGVASFIAYEGFGHQLDLTTVKYLVKNVALKPYGHAVQPDYTVLLDISVATARQRMQGKKLDRWEQLGDEYLKRIQQGYQTIAGHIDQPVVVIDAEQPLETVAEAMWQQWQQITRAHAKEAA